MFKIIDCPQECDLGQQSILHAVRAPPQRNRRNNNSANTIEESESEVSEVNDSGTKPMNETLTDLSLEELNESQTVAKQGGHKKQQQFVENFDLKLSFVKLGWWQKYRNGEIWEIF